MEQNNWHQDEPKMKKSLEKFLARTFKGNTWEIKFFKRSESGWYQGSIQFAHLPNPSGFMWSEKEQTWKQTY